MNRTILFTIAFMFASLQTFAQNANRYTYDNLNRLTSVTYANGITVQYTYDAVGNRLSKTVSDGSQQELAVTTASVSQVGATTATCGGNVTIDGDDSTVTARGVCWSEHANPTINDSHTSDGSGTGSFTSIITGLTPNTTYYVRAYATNSSGTVYGEEVTFTTTISAPVVIDEKSCPSSPTVTDHEGNVYATVQIGHQCWMRDNLRTTTSPSTGTYLIPAEGTGYTFSGKQARWYNEDSITYAPMNYGLLYNWNAAVDTFNTAYGEISVNSNSFNSVSVNFTDHRRGICPVGWHLPSDAEWTTMTDFVSSQSEYVCGDNTSYIAKALANSVGWDSEMVSCGIGYEQSMNNATGFSAVPAGSRDNMFHGAGRETGFWSSSQNYTGFYAYFRHLTINYMGEFEISKSVEYSVRCLKDENSTSAIRPTVTTNELSDITPTTATCGGNVTDDGGAEVTERGVCWSEHASPTKNDNHTIDGNGTGSFTSNITGLTPNTTYYVRAYATNSVGTVYGTQRTFTTECDMVNVSISGNTTITDGQSTTLTASGANSYSWSTGSTNSYITVSPTSTTTYTVTGTNSYGCTATASVTVTVEASLPTVSTATVSNVGVTSAICGGNVTDDGGATVTARGVCWSTSQNPTISGSHTTDGNGTGSFTSIITELTPNTTYYVRAYATNSVGTAYGEQKTFTTECDTVNISIFGSTTITYGQTTTLIASGANSYSWSTGSSNSHITVSPTSITTYTVTGTDSYGCTDTASVTVTVETSLPTVTTATVSNVGLTSAICGGNVTFNGGATVTARGVCWSTSQNPTIADSHTTDGSGTGSFTSNITGLTPNTTYYVRAYATNSSGTVYGEELTFTTMTATSTFTCGDNLIVGNYSYTTQQYGSQCWMTQNLRNSAGSERISWPDLLQACPTGWHLPNNNEWNTLGNYISSHSSSVDFGNGDYWSSDIMQYGEYSIILPTLVQSNSIVTGGNGVACEVQAAANCECLINSCISVRCLKDENNTSAVLPTITTGELSDITPTTATCGGNVTDDGGAEVTERGVCWSEHADPTINDNHTTDGNGTGSFTSNITELTPNTTYYVRAYATNSVGTVYGTQSTFTTECDMVNVVISGSTTIIYEQSTTLTASGANSYSWSTGSINSYIIVSPTSSTTYTVTGTNSYGCTATASVTVTVEASLPTVTTATVSNVGLTSAICGGNVTDDGGATVMARGVCWSTSQNPTIADSYTTDGSGTGSFTSNITGLTPNTTYYMRAYATNSKGTAYGKEMSFTTQEMSITYNLIAVSNTRCSAPFDGEIVIYDISPATGQYVYKLSNGSGDLTEFQSDNDFENLPADIYTVTIMDLVSGKTVSETVILTDSIIQPTVSINVTENTICQGGELTLTANILQQADNGLNFQWYSKTPTDPDFVMVPYANEATYVTQLDNSTEFMIKATHALSGCYGMDTVTVVATANPTVTITSSNGLVLCEGGTTTLTAHPQHDIFTDYTYLWYLNGLLLPGATDSTFVMDNYTAGENTYNCLVQIMASNGYSNGCITEAAVNLNVVSDPTAYIHVNEGVNTICEGGTVSFTVDVIGGVSDSNNPYSYAWYNDMNDNIILGTDATFTTSAYDTASLYVYHVDITSAYGCDVQAYSDPLRIVKDPTVNVSVKPGEDTAVCNGGYTTLIATVEGGFGEFYYQWYKNGYAIPYATGNVLITDALYLNEPTVYTVSVAQSGIACTATSSPFSVPVYGVAEVAIAANHDAICTGSSATLTSTVTNGIDGDVLTYQWYRDGFLIDDANGATYVTDDNLAAGYHEYMLIVSSSTSGCHSAVSGTVGILVENKPVVSISSNVDNNTVCEGTDITLTANLIYDNTSIQHNTTYTWKWTDNTVINSVTTTDPHFTLSPTMATGSYNFFVESSSTDGSGCDAISPSINLSILPISFVSVTASTDESCQGADVTFTANVTPSNITGSFFWNVNDQQLITNEANLTVNNMAIGTNNISVVFVPDDHEPACNSVSTSITHFVHGVPVVTIAASDPDHLTMCAGGTVSFAASTNGFDVSPDHFVWRMDSIIMTENSNLFTTQVNTPGIHTFSAMVEQDNGCNAAYSTPIVVTVAEQPTAQLTQIEGYTEMCVGGQISLMANVSNYANENDGVTNHSVHGTYTYTWYRGTTEIMTTANVLDDNVQIIDTLNDPASYTYSVAIAASGYNCQTAHANLNHQINVVPDPSWSVNQVNPTELCIGGIVTLNAEVTGGVENLQAGRIQWYKTFGGVETEVVGLGGVNTDVPEAAGVYTYAPMYIDYIGAGCNIENATATQVTVNALPTATFTSGNYDIVCTYDEQSFAMLTISLSGITPFSITIKNMTTGEEETIVTSLTTYQYPVHPYVSSIYRILSVSDANGCTGVMDQVEDVVVISGDVQIAADSIVATCEEHLTIIPLETGIDLPIEVGFNATLSDGSVQTGNVMYDSYTQHNYVEVQMPATAGDYMVNIEIYSCSDDVHVIVPPGLQTSEFYVSDTTCYTWNNVEYCESGEYVQNFQTIYGCDSVVTMHLTITTVGVNQYSTLQNFHINAFPNPTHHAVNIEIDNELIHFAKAEIHDAVGRKIKDISWSVPSSKQHIDMEDLTNGVYFLRLFNENGYLGIVKIVKIQ